MSSFFLFLLFFVLWITGFYLQLHALHKQLGLSTVTSYLRRCVFSRYPLDFNDREDEHRRLFFGIFLMIKVGKILLFSLLLRVVIFARRAEAVLLILLLLALGSALYYLFFFKDERHTGYRSVYTLSGEFGVYEIVLAPGGFCGEWIGATLAELDLRKKDLLVLSVLRAGKVIVFPKGPEILLAGDHLLVFGKNTTLPLSTRQEAMES
ncbi:MAG: hypothetical protein GX050_08920 [Firmicutes bacterium]|nr:hypothetical protein [Bacillota bacterium]